MAIRICPNCMNIIKKKDEKCSKCGMLVSDMITEKEELKQKIENQKIEKEREKLQQDIEGVDDLNNVGEREDSVKPKRHKHKSKAQAKDVPQYTVDEDGSFNIDTRDVTFLDNSSYSTKKERGDFKPEKIKWWEIYKWADLYLARRKIMKEVNKAAKEKPSFIKKHSMILWCLFFGWMGAHNYYAKNYKKGIVMSVCMTICIVFVSVPGLASVATFIGGGTGFVAFYLWFTDFVLLLMNKFKYRLSKEAFIAKLNVETRYKISKKYISTEKIKAEQENIKAKLQRKLEKKEAKNRARTQK